MAGPASIVTHEVTTRPRRGGRVGTAVAVMLLAAACASATPEVPAGPDGEPDPVLVEGRQIYRNRCAGCHGGAGEGGRGPRLGGGAVVEAYPDIADQVAVVTDGRGGMPAWGGVLDEAEIEAVVRFTREVL
ncbi:MAG: cytochrome c [Actinomyces sp.]|nr:MAG: cytochrome c [Actinomyces sp.]